MLFLQPFFSFVFSSPLHRLVFLQRQTYHFSENHLHFFAESWLRFPLMIFTVLISTDHRQPQEKCFLLSTALLQSRYAIFRRLSGIHISSTVHCTTSKQQLSSSNAAMCSYTSLSQQESLMSNWHFTEQLFMDLVLLGNFRELTCGKLSWMRSSLQRGQFGCLRYR